jgi:nitrite reductase/ring-hydroxylating ferredoxin subunit
MPTSGDVPSFVFARGFIDECWHFDRNQQGLEANGSHSRLMSEEIMETKDKEAHKVLQWSTLHDRTPTHALVENVDLVVVRNGDDVHALYGRCLHRGALLADGHIDGDNLICGVHQWDFQFATGVSEYNNEEVLAKFDAWVDETSDGVFVDAAQVRAWHDKNPQPYQRDQYLGQYADSSHEEIEESHNAYIQRLAREGLSVVGHHGASWPCFFNGSADRGSAAVERPATSDGSTGKVPAA